MSEQKSFATLQEELANKYPCSQCNEPNYGWVSGEVCSKCVKANHAVACHRASPAQQRRANLAGRA